MTPTERAELTLFGTSRGEHTGNLERDLYAISQATLVRTIEAAEQDVLSRVAQTPPDGFVSVELLNIERAVSDDLRERNAKLRAQTALTDEQRDALERMAGHDPRDTGLSWSDNLLLIQSAAQAAKDVLSTLPSTECGGSDV